MTSATYQLFAQALRKRKQIACMYGGHHRELCPIVLGHSDGEEKALTFQVAGASSSGLPPGGEWRCLVLSKVSFARLHEGEWKSGDSHAQPQGCVQEVDLDANPDSPYSPKRK
ncbi:MAG: hypothetical protein NT015_08025 [Alphaproteobacteria bacterium]|nr:hypothetical protein [Alphaproteobacteria bacterium]